MAAFFSTDARSQALMKTGEAPVQVMLSINAFHLIDQGLNVKVITPADRPGLVGIDTVAIMAGTKKAEAAHQFISLALSREVQADRGAARVRYEAVNQHGEVVLRLTGVQLLGRRPAG